PCRGQCHFWLVGRRSGDTESAGVSQQRGCGRNPDLMAASSAARSSHIRVRYAETDQMGVVYYANYFVWFEVGRTDWLRAAGSTYRAMEKDGVSLPVIEAHTEYRRAA